VSVASGGIVPKSALGYALENSRSAYLGSFMEGEVPLSERLCVDDPLTGRDMAAGSYRIDLVKAALQKAARRLEALAKGRKMTDTTINYLSALFDVQKVRCRGERAEGLRAAARPGQPRRRAAGLPPAPPSALPAAWATHQLPPPLPSPPGQVIKRQYHRDDDEYYVVGHPRTRLNRWAAGRLAPAPPPAADSLSLSPSHWRPARAAELLGRQTAAHRACTAPAAATCRADTDLPPRPACAARYGDIEEDSSSEEEAAAAAMEEAEQDDELQDVPTSQRSSRYRR
jgi:hypothetical protein